MTKKQKEKLYVHVIFNEAWIHGFLFRGEDSWTVFKRVLMSEIRQTIKYQKLTDHPFTLSIYKESYPKMWDISVIGEFGRAVPKGSKAREVERVMKETVDAFMREWC